MIAHKPAGFALGAAVALGLLAAAAPAFGQAAAAKPSSPALKTTPPSPVVPPRAEAYYQFMLGRELEGDGDIDGAIKAYRQASKFDPKSAEIVAELAGLYARENRVQESTDAAHAALAIDPSNVSAHRVLAIINASLARIDQGTGPLDAQSAAYASKAAEHLEAARKGRELPEPGLDLMLARIYIRLGDRDKAIGVLSGMVVENPGQPEPVRMLLQQYQQAGRSADAISLLESVVADQPSFYPPLGDLYGKAHRWDDAARAFEQSLAVNGTSPDVRRQLASAWFETREPAKVSRALDLLEQVRKDRPADPTVLYALALVQYYQLHLDQAEATARDLMRVAPGALVGPYALSLVLGQKHEFQQVVDTLEPVVEKQAAKQAGFPPEYAPLLLRLGMARYSLGDIDGALTVLEQARAASPERQDPLIDLYVLQSEFVSRRYEEAAALASKLRASRPGDLRVARLSADIFRQLGQPDDGVALLTESLDQHLDDVTAYFALAEFDVKLQRFDAAMKVLDRAAAKFPSNIDVVFEIGSALERQNRFADAEQKFREVLAKDPRHAPALNYLGYMMANRGEHLDESIGYIKRALEIDPNNGSYLDSLGWAYFRQNKLDLAEENLKKAADGLWLHSAIQDHYGDLLFKLGRYPEAATAWQRALKGDMEQVDRATIEKKLRSARDKTRKH